LRKSGSKIAVVVLNNSRFTKTVNIPFNTGNYRIVDSFAAKKFNLGLNQIEVELAALTGMIVVLDET
jgi:hypothetical protein